MMSMFLVPLFMSRNNNTSISMKIANQDLRLYPTWTIKKYFVESPETSHKYHYTTYCENQPKRNKIHLINPSPDAMITFQQLKPSK